MSVVRLTAAELQLFNVLRSRPGAWVTMEELIEALKSTSSRPDTVVRAMLSRIRRQFEIADLGNPIEAAYRGGYRLTEKALSIQVADRSASKAGRALGELS